MQPDTGANSTGSDGRAASKRRAEGGFRADIEGLRALAVLGVVLFHAHIPSFGGGFVGVDIFYVISGFLITGLVIKEIEASGRLSLKDFWARRMRRLLPAAAVVLVATLGMSFLILDALSFRQVARDVLSAATYVSNWNFAAQAVDYLAADAPPSPVLHYWSLSVEEQFYILWPLMFAAIAAFTLRRHITAFRRRQWAAAVSVVGLLSLAGSVWLTQHNQPYAFFSTPTRAWQLALGAALALSSQLWSRQSRQVRLMLGVVGLSAVGFAFVQLSDAGGRTPYPGLLALIPTFGAAALIASGMHADSPTLVQRLLSVRPLRFIGRVSYSWYLWHWPPLVLAAAYVGHAISALQSVVISIATLVLAWLTYRFVEDPMRRAPRLVASARTSLGMGVVATSAVAALALVAPALAGGVALVQPPQGGFALPNPTASSSYAPGVYTLGPRDAQLQRPVVYNNGCHVGALSAPTLLPCVFGDPNGKKTVLLFGDSHAAQWFPALNKATKANNYRFISWTRAGCPWFALPVQNMKTSLTYPTCAAWQKEVMRRIALNPPDVIFVATIEHGYRADVGKKFLDIDASQPLVTQAIRKTLPLLVKSGAKIVFLRDTPHMGVDVPRCVMRNLKQPERCAMPRNLGFAGGGIDAVTATSVAGVQVADFTPTLCGPAPRPCDVVRQGMVLYRDSNHITVTYSELLASLFQPYLKP